jgi:hypothetical protein
MSEHVFSLGRLMYSTSLKYLSVEVKKVWKDGGGEATIIFIHHATVSFIVSPFSPTPNQKLISFITMLRSGCGMFHYMLQVQLFIQHQHAPHKGRYTQWEKPKYPVVIFNMVIFLIRTTVYSSWHFNLVTTAVIPINAIYGQTFISNLSNDRSKASSKTIPLLNAI